MISESQRRRYKQAKLAYQAFIKLYPLGLDDLEGEEWRDIKGYEGGYKVSNFGRVKSFKRKEPYIMKPVVHDNGYLWVGLSKDNVTKNFYVHVLVATAFIPNPEGKPQINHIDSCKHNCHVSNLEWVTVAENKEHAVKMGLIKAGEDHPRAKFINEQITYIRDNPDNLTAIELAEMFDVNESAIREIQLGRHYKSADGEIREKKPPGLPRVPDKIRAKIRAEYKPGVYGCGCKAIGKKYGFSATTIWNIVREDKG